jgi:hypothetical protein
MCAKPNMLKAPAARVAPLTDKLDPMRAILRKEIPLPTDVKLKTDTLPPTRANERIEKADPK